ncbi:MAG: hypothetical protein RBT49_17775 [Bacteroidales bacterium]|nr:hypothetical protein [Bacteroidales bacterium]
MNENLIYMNNIRILLFLIVFFWFFQSCKNVKKNETTAKCDTTGLTKCDLSNDNVLTNSEFSNYLKYFNHAILPIEIKGCSINVDELFEFSSNKSRKFNMDYSYAYCQIPTNGNFIATIVLGVADCYLPVLTTYTLNGEIIDKKVLSIGYGEIDCGQHTEDYMILEKDYKINISDTLNICECDSSYNLIEETCQQYVIYKKGRILSDGKIELTDEIKKKLKK